jgi:hypothetical protein
MKFGELIDGYVHLQHKIAVANKIFSIMEEYVEGDIGESPIIVDESCIRPAVSSEAVEDVLSDLHDYKKSLEKELEKYKNYSTTDKEKSKKK